MNTESMKWLSIGGSALLLAGCASMSDKLDASMGQPVEQLVQALGQPDADFRLQTGERVLQWQTVSSRKQPRHAYSVPRMTYVADGIKSHSVPDVKPEPMGQAFDPGEVVIEACVLWVMVGPEGNILQGASHGKAC